MATLEKIRSKSVFLIVVIGVALIAFIIGDFLTSGRSIFGNDRTVATVGGEKIDVLDFQQRYNNASQQMQGRSGEIDQAVLQQQVLEGMIQEQLITKELKALGIEVSSEELTEFMTGKNANYQIQQFAQQIGASSPAELYKIVNSPAEYGLTTEQVEQLKQQLKALEDQTEEVLKYTKFERLVSGAIQANKLDKKALNADNTIYNISFVKKSLADLNDSEFEVSEAEIKNEYNKTKERYRISADEVRYGNVISVNIVPSDVDEQEGQQLFEDAVVSLRDNEGVAAVLANDMLTVKQSTTTLERMSNPTIKEFLEKAAVEQLSEVNHAGEKYSVTKLLGKKVESEEVKVTVVIAQGDQDLQDSILVQLNSGVELSTYEKSENVQVAQQDEWLNLIDLADKDTKAKLLAAGSDYFAVNATAQGAVFCKVTEKKAPVTQYDIAEVSYTVEPSETTKQNLRDKLQSYIIENNKQATFASQAIPAGYQAMEVQLTKEMPQINGIKDSRKVIQWAFNAKEQEVSPIFEANDANYIVFAVNKIVKSNYVPVSDPAVNRTLTEKVRNDKKAAKLIADYAGKANSLEEYATVMGGNVDTTNVNLNSPYIALIGFDPELEGTIAGTAVGKLAGPVKGNYGVYVYKVESVDNTGTTLSDEETASRYSQRFGGEALTSARQGQSPVILEVLREANPVKNQMIRFY